jgi:cellulose synthase/poly-beta-1,6-N-acetylglucosamine synthase-like glycosyltransferase
MLTLKELEEPALNPGQELPGIFLDKEIGKGQVTVLVPAYNEARSIADTIQSLRAQTVPVHEIIVIDDVSSDDTGEVARSLGCKVLVPPQNTGSKAGAQNFALQHVSTEFTMAIDADTTLAVNAIEKLMVAFDEPEVAAACGFVVPRTVDTIWERGRYIEYLFAFSFYKPIQDYFAKPLISSGCFSLYRTDTLKENNGWSMRTLAEDMDLTWSYYIKGYRVRFIPEAVCYPIEPHNFLFLKKQLKRWSHGFIQNVRLHWHDIRTIEYLNYTVTIALWDAVVASLVYMIVLPVLSVLFLNPIFLLGYVIDIPAVLVPTFMVAFRRKEVFRLLASLPAFFILRAVNSIFLLEAIWSEIVLKRTFKVYEKGH